MGAELSCQGAEGHGDLQTSRWFSGAATHLGLHQLSLIFQGDAARRKVL
jgi:hypothetical protein